MCEGNHLRSGESEAGALLPPVGGRTGTPARWEGPPEGDSGMLHGLLLFLFVLPFPTDLVSSVPRTLGGAQTRYIASASAAQYFVLSLGRGCIRQHPLSNNDPFRWAQKRDNTLQ